MGHYLEVVFPRCNLLVLQGSVEDGRLFRHRLAVEHPPESDRNLRQHVLPLSRKFHQWVVEALGPVVPIS